MRVTLISGLILFISAFLKAGEPIRFTESSWSSIGVRNEMNLTKKSRGVIRTGDKTLILQLLDSKRVRKGIFSSDSCNVICISISDTEIRTDVVKGFAQYKHQGDLTKGDIEVISLHYGSDKLPIGEYGLQWVLVSGEEILVKPAAGTRYAATLVESGRNGD